MARHDLDTGATERAERAGERGGIGHIDEARLKQCRDVL